MFIDGGKVGEGRIERTVPVAFSIDETLDVGRDSGAPVSPDYESRDNTFNGDVLWVHIASAATTTTGAYQAQSGSRQPWFGNRRSHEDE